MGPMVRRRSLLIVIAVASISPGAAVATPGDHPYIALGDSVSAGYGASSSANGVVNLLYGDYSASLGADQVLNYASGGATSGSLRTGGQLTTTLAEINAPTDTVAVTIGIGGNDLLSGPCGGHWDEPAICPTRANLAETLAQLKSALDADPGAEPFTVMAYYNPSTGLGGAAGSSTDQRLFGANLVVGCSDSGVDVGLNDVVYQEADKLGLPVANPYPAFKQAGRAYIASDNLHPNDAGHAAIAQAFREATATCPASTGPDPTAIDVDPPQTRILAGSHGRRHQATAHFRVGSDEKGSTFRCKLDAGPMSACGSRRTYRHLRPGRHKFRVIATDSSGNRDPTPANRRWWVLPPAG